ncbi:hypothetical protein ACHAXT_012902 [Thalassiosira profunda]
MLPARLPSGAAAILSRRPSRAAGTYQAPSLQRRFQSTTPPTNGGGNSPFRKDAHSALSTLSTLGHLLAAGTGTFASTLFALYLATVVESSAHESLYENFPHWYAEIREEDLPMCVRERELSRRVTGVVVEGNRAKGVEGRDGLMGMDGWMEVSVSDGGNSILDAEAAELLAEAEFERRQEAKGMNNTASMAGWQRRMTEKREGIIAKEEREFSRGLPTSASTSETQTKRLGEGAKKGLATARKVHEEAARKLQERLASVAMTA